MSEKNGNSNTVAIVAILVVAVLVMGGVYLMQGGDEGGTAPAAQTETETDNDPDFSMDIQDENGNSFSMDSE